MNSSLLRRILSGALLLTTSYSVSAADAYPCHNCSEAGYKQAAKARWMGVDRDIYIYDFASGVYRFYSVYGVRNGDPDNPRRTAVADPIQLGAQAETQFNQLRLMWQANGGTFRKDVHLNLQADLSRNWTVYGLVRTGSYRSLLSDQLMATQFEYGGARRTLNWIRDNVVGGSVGPVGINLRETDTTIRFVIRTADGGRVVFVYDHAAASRPDMVTVGIDAPHDGDANPIPLSSSAGGAGTYTFSSSSNLQQFLQQARDVGILVSGNPTGNTLTCIFDGQGTLTCR